MAAPSRIPEELKGQYGSGDYVVIKDGKVIKSTWCSLRAFSSARDNNAAVYDGMNGSLIRDYTDGAGW